MGPSKHFMVLEGRATRPRGRVEMGLACEVYADEEPQGYVVGHPVQLAALTAQWLPKKLSGPGNETIIGRQKTVCFDGGISHINSKLRHTQ